MIGVLPVIALIFWVIYASKNGSVGYCINNTEFPDILRDAKPGNE